MEELKKKLLAEIEIGVEALITAKCDEAVHAGLEALKKAIPGMIDDAILGAAEASIKEAIKAALLAQAEKISPEV